MYTKKHFPLLHILTAGTLALALVAGSTVSGRADSLQSLKDQYAALQQQEQQVQGQLDTQNSKISTQQQKIDALGSAIQLTKRQITVLSQRIEETDNLIDAKNKEISAVQQRVDANYALFKQRICVMYEMGDTSFVDVLLSSQSLTDFLTHVETMKFISKHDSDLVSSLRQDVTTLQADQATLQSSRQDSVQSKGALSAKKALLQAQMDQQTSVKESLKKGADTIQSTINSINEKARYTDKQINAIIEQEASAARAKARRNSSAGSSFSLPSSGFGSPDYVVSYAESFCGVPYVFGCADPSIGFDCSGLVQYVFANAAGIYLPHSAAGQYELGDPVDATDLQPGDLVFFATGGGGVSHVGIYAGNDEFVEANSGYSTGHEVMVAPLFRSSYWASCYVGARRILGVLN